MFSDFSYQIRTLLIFALCVGATSARADFYLHSWQDFHEPDERLTLDARLNFYGTTSNYQADGSVVQPSGLNRYSRFQPEVTASWALSPRFTIFGRLSFENASLDATTPLSSSGLGDQTIGANYRVLEKKRPDGSMPFSLDFQAQFDFPAYSNGVAPGTTTTTSLYLGDSSYDGTIGIFGILGVLNHSEADLSIKGGVGFTLRSNNFSAALPWSLAGEYRPHNAGLLASAGAFGFLSLKTDPNPGTSSTAVRPTANASGSFINYATDPALAYLFARLGYQTSPDFEFYAGVAVSVWGQSAPLGSDIFGGIQVHILPDSAHVHHTVDLPPSRYGKSNKGFVDYSLDAKVLRVNDRLNLIKIDKGADDSVVVGELFDIFRTRPDGTPVEAVARANVSSTKASESALQVVEYYKEVLIEEGYVAKRVVE